jgi:G:T/U-mismatch repair DNA glycosylase
MEDIKSIHPFEPFIPEGANKLIIGTMPPPRFCKNHLEDDDVNFYYGSRDNDFWLLLAEITNTDDLHYENTPDAIEQRKKILVDLKSGITDIVKTCVHEGGHASDKDLSDIEYNDIQSLLKEHPQISTLIYTSEKVKRYINEHLRINGHLRTYHSSEDKTKRKWSININNKKYDVIILYSPSPRALGRVSKEKRKEQYREVFLTLNFEKNKE